MYFIIDRTNKVIVGWSAKCGCTHVKRLFNYIINHNNEKHIDLNIRDVLPKNIGCFTTIIVSRNPYKRVVSGFLEKYKGGGNYRKNWKYNKITFTMFINEVLKNNWKMINYHHFTPQTTENFNMNILKSKQLKIFDIENIDYNYIETLYNIKIPEEILLSGRGHKRKEYPNTINRCVSDLTMKTYIHSNVNYKYFYNKELNIKVLRFYKNDFIFFNKYGNMKYKSLSN